jgi:hypothetical protein
MTSIHHLAFIFGSITLIMWRGAVGVSTSEISGSTIAALYHWRAGRVPLAR